MTGDPLAQLRDIHLPRPISEFPIAPGWWITLVAVIALVLALFYLVRRIKAGSARKQALTMLENLITEYRIRGEATALYSGLSLLLRRYALACFPRRDVAGLSGEQWLRFLDDTGGKGQFQDGVGRVLTSGPYQKSPSVVDAQALIALVRRWIKNAKS